MEVKRSGIGEGLQPRVRTAVLETILRGTRRAFRRIETFLARTMRSPYFATEWGGGRHVAKACAELKDQIGQLQKLASIGQMAAGIAHELNSPTSYVLTNLSSIGTYTRDLTELFRAADAVAGCLDTGRDSAAAREEYRRLRRDLDADFVLTDLRTAVDESVEGARRILEFVSILKDFSRPDEAAMKPSDLNETVENAIKICWNELKYKAAVRRDYGRVGPVLCNAQRISQVVLNLLVNAAHAIIKRGEICVSTREEDGHAVIRVADTGRGIRPEDLGKIFRPFFTTKPPGQGTGLGLHMAYQTVKAHGGKIDVTTQVGRGTEFLIRLPLAGPKG